MSDSPKLQALAAGRYQLEGVVGEGGFATVYQARDTVLGVPRAIKVLSAVASRRASIKRRLKAEARAMALIAHPNVLRVYDIASEVLGDRDLSYVVMDLAPGGNLMDWTRVHGRMPPDLAMRYSVQILSALAAAHAAGIIHRDVKPQNILLDSMGVVLLADFGIALLAGDGELRATRTGVAMGSFAYMAPEQRIDARSVGPTADLYAVAATLYFLVTGSNPVDLFAAEPGSERWTGLPAPLAAILQRATAHEPLERFLDARGFAQALLEALDQVGSQPLASAQPWDPSSFPDPSEHFSGVASTRNLSASMEAPSLAPPIPAAVSRATREAQTYLEVLPVVGPGATSPALSPEEIRALGPLQRRLMGAPPTLAEDSPSGTASRARAAQTLVASSTAAPPAPRSRAWIGGLILLGLLSIWGGLLALGTDRVRARSGTAPVVIAPAAALTSDGEPADDAGLEDGAEPPSEAEPTDEAGRVVGDGATPGSADGVADAELAPPLPDYGPSAVAGVWTGTFASAGQIAVTLVLRGDDGALTGSIESVLITARDRPSETLQVAGRYDPSRSLLTLDDLSDRPDAGSYRLIRSGGEMSGTLTLRSGLVRPIALSRP